MAHTIITNICENKKECIDACPVNCIYTNFNSSQKQWSWIDFNTCIDCGICIAVCPTENAIISTERPELQLQ